MDTVPDELKALGCVIFFEVYDEPRYVPIGKISNLFHMPKGLKEVFINYYCHLLAPSTKRGHFYLQLGH